MADLLGSVLWVINEAFGPFANRFYLFAWLIIRPVVWLFTLLMVYSLLEKILVQLPGLLRLSRQVLYGVFSIAILVGLISARLEYLAPGFTSLPKKHLLVQWWMAEMVLDRVIASTSLLSLVAILIFLFWFPITIPRNLAVFSVGLVVYFAAITTLLLVRSLWPDEPLHYVFKLMKMVSILIGCISGACFAFWSLYLSSAGEVVESRMAVQRQPQEQERLIAQLELLNDTLLKAARR